MWTWWHHGTRDARPLNRERKEHVLTDGAQRDALPEKGTTGDTEEGRLRNTRRRDRHRHGVRRRERKLRNACGPQGGGVTSGKGGTGAEGHALQLAGSHGAGPGSLVGWWLRRGLFHCFKTGCVPRAGRQASGASGAGNKIRHIVSRGLGCTQGQVPEVPSGLFPWTRGRGWSEHRGVGPVWAEDTEGATLADAEGDPRGQRSEWGVCRHPPGHPSGQRVRCGPLIHLPEGDL